MENYFPCLEQTNMGGGKTEMFKRTLVTTRKRKLGCELEIFLSRIVKMLKVVASDLQGGKFGKFSIKQ